MSSSSSLPPASSPSFVKRGKCETDKSAKEHIEARGVFSQQMVEINVGTSGGQAAGAACSTGLLKVLKQMFNVCLRGRNVLVLLRGEIVCVKVHSSRIL